MARGHKLVTDVGRTSPVRLLAHAETTRTKVVLLGDPCQLPEIEAGGAFRGLQGRLGTGHLTDNRRQTCDDLNRVTALEQKIDISERLERVAERSLERGRDLGLEL